MYNAALYDDVAQFSYVTPVLQLHLHFVNFEERIESNKPAIQFDCHPNPLYPNVNELFLTLDVTFHIEIIIVHATTALTFRERSNTLKRPEVHLFSVLLVKFVRR